MEGEGAYLIEQIPKTLIQLSKVEFKKLSDQHKFSIANQVIDLVKQCHANNIVHKNITLESFYIQSNCLEDENIQQQLFLSKFGDYEFHFQHIFKSKDTHEIVKQNIHLFSRESINKKGVSFYTDIWQMGIVLHSILNNDEAIINN